jgi:hypothetical protein
MIGFRRAELIVHLNSSDGAAAALSRGPWRRRSRWRGGRDQCRVPGTVARMVSVFAFLVFLSTFTPRPALAEGSAFGESSLRDLLQKNPATGLPVDSIRELVPLLPDELRANFTFVYESRSPFRTSISPDYPRAILFTKDARLVLTFTGDVREPGADLLESMSFDEKTAKFELHAYLLPAAERSGWRPSPEAANCERCHGADPRPIFDSYPLWPGFYGSEQDTFPRDRIGTREHLNYKKFLAGAAKTGVYQGLIFPAGSPVSPYLDPRSFHPEIVEAPAEPLRFLPNTRLGMALTEMNRQRIYRKLAEGKGFAANEKQLLAELLECGPVRGASPGAVRLIEEQLKRENAGRLKRLGVRPGDPRPERNDMQELQFTHELAQIEWVAGRAGVDTSDWSMALEPGSLAFFDGILSGMHGRKSFYVKEDLIFEMLAHLRRREPAFDRYFTVIRAYADLGYSFGNRIDIGSALRSCRLLRSAGSAHSPDG